MSSRRPRAVTNHKKSACGRRHKTQEKNAHQPGHQAMVHGLVVYHELKSKDGWTMMDSLRRARVTLPVLCDVHDDSVRNWWKPA
eukprot:4252283-Amphidinium_carterae.1